METKYALAIYAVALTFAVWGWFNNLVLVVGYVLFAFAAIFTVISEFWQDDQRKKHKVV